MTTTRSTRVRGFRLGNGEPGDLLGVINISAQKAAERAACAAEERSRQMPESSPIAVAVINRPEGTPPFANTRALVLANTDMVTFMGRLVTAWFRDPRPARAISRA